MGNWKVSNTEPISSVIARYTDISGMCEPTNTDQPRDIGVLARARDVTVFSVFTYTSCVVRHQAL